MYQVLVVASTGASSSAVTAHLSAFLLQYITFLFLCLSFLFPFLSPSARFFVCSNIFQVLDCVDAIESFALKIVRIRAILTIGRAFEDFQFIFGLKINI